MCQFNSTCNVGTYFVRLVASLKALHKSLNVLLSVAVCTSGTHGSLDTDNALRSCRVLVQGRGLVYGTYHTKPPEIYKQICLVEVNNVNNAKKAITCQSTFCTRTRVLNEKNVYHKWWDKSVILTDKTRIATKLSELIVSLRTLKATYTL